MSPLARSLLALACAALLRDASATYPDWPGFDPEHCTMTTIGDRRGFIVFERELGLTLIKTKQVTIPEIQRRGIELAEEIVVVCSDLGTPPTVTPPPTGFSPIEVQQQPWNPWFPQELLMTVYQAYRVVAPDPTLIPYPL